MLDTLKKQQHVLSGRLPKTDLAGIIGVSLSHNITAYIAPMFPFASCMLKGCARTLKFDTMESEFLQG